MFALFDTETNMYKSSPYDTSKQYPTAHYAKIYKRKGHAINAASFSNVGRVVPPGRTPDHKYQNRPQVVVVELDQSFAVVATYTAPPSYIYL